MGEGSCITCFDEIQKDEFRGVFTRLGKMKVTSDLDEMVAAKLTRNLH